MTSEENGGGASLTAKRDLHAVLQVESHSEARQPTDEHLRDKKCKLPTEPAGSHYRPPPMQARLNINKQRLNTRPLKSSLDCNYLHRMDEPIDNDEEDTILQTGAIKLENLPMTELLNGGDRRALSDGLRNDPASGTVCRLLEPQSSNGYQCT